MESTRPFMVLDLSDSLECMPLQSLGVSASQSAAQNREKQTSGGHALYHIDSTTLHGALPPPQLFPASTGDAHQHSQRQARPSRGKFSRSQSHISRFSVSRALVSFSISTPVSIGRRDNDLCWKAGKMEETKDEATTEIIQELETKIIMPDRLRVSSTKALYGGKIQRTPMMDMLRQTIKRSRLQRLDDILSSRCASVQVLLENVQDPHNGSVCIRSADSFGLMYVNATEYFVPFSYEPDLVEKSDEFVQIRRFPDCIQAADKLKQEGFYLFATCLDEDAVSVSDIDFCAYDKICLIFGNEERGISKAMLARADQKVYLPMVGMVQSLNMSASFAQFLYHLRSVNRIRPDLSNEELTQFHERWIISTCKNPRKILRKQNFDYPML